MEIDPRRLDLAREFKAKPFGVHSPDLQAVLNRMRSQPPRGRYCLYMTRQHAEWTLARMTGEPLRPELLAEYVFRSVEDAEWAVFRLRWKELTGEDLALEGDTPLPAPGPGRPLPAAPAIMAYTDRAGVAPGETLGFKVSCQGAASYRADIVRLLAPETGPDEPGFREEVVPTSVSRDYPGRVQEIQLGSYVIVPASPHFALESFTVQAFVWPTRPGKGRQALLGTWSDATRAGFGLGLDGRGALDLTLGDGTRAEHVTTGVPLAERKWYFVAASYDAASRVARLHQEPVADRTLDLHGPVHVESPVALTPRHGAGPFLMAAAHRGEAKGKLLTTGHYDGKIDRPRLAGRALTRAEMAGLGDGPGTAGLETAVVAAWDFSLDIPTERITDRAPNRLHGETVNLPARAMTGHNWTGDEMNWRRAPHQYGAIHFHEDDLADAGWEDDFALTVPADMRSGVYAARVRAGEASAHAVFFVVPPRGPAAAPPRARPKIAFLASTATYTVYCNNRNRFVATWTELVQGRLTVMDATDRQGLDHPLGLSTYCTHSDGSGVCYGTRLRPATNIRPTGRLWNFCADLFVIDWLEWTGLGYDVITDDDLHREGVELLAPYRVVVTGSHPEYDSLEMLDALDAYLRRGGRLMYMGGNGFYWRIAYHPTQPGIIEVRRSEDGTRAWAAEVGEYYHSFTGEYGGLWRRQGRAPNLLAGVGFISQGFDASTYYRRRPASRDPRAAWMFQGIGEGELIGDFGTLRGGAAGLEIDSHDRLLGSPAHALVVASSEGHSNTFQLVNEAVLVAHGATDGPQSPLVRADMVFFECPSGGAVFSTGSIAYAGSLPCKGHDNNVARLTTTVLRRFVDPTPFVMPKPAG
ncbi:MAG: N,N-dimethylformamidase beta subunit family domain-containing protein [Candidatus Rokuibacteriota bacterium]